MASITPDELTAIAIDACRAGADRIRSSTSRRAVATKSTSSDIVTATDLAAERLIRDLIAVRAPGSRLLGEEGGHITAGEGPHADVEWVVDPLDGTVNFAFGLPVAAVSVAAVVGGRPVAAAVVDVASGETFQAHDGGGAWSGSERLHVGACATVADALVATGFSYDPASRADHGRTIAELVGRVRDIRAFGSAALHLCWVAAGRLDAYAERDIKPWDHAGGALIAAEAGASVELPCIENRNLVLVANPLLYGLLRPFVA